MGDTVHNMISGSGITGSLGTMTDVRTPREKILDEAKELTAGQRAADYGPPKDSFEGIAGLWEKYLDRPISSTDVAIMMMLLKVSRIKTGGSPEGKDSWVDIAGYAACGYEVSL